MLKRLLAKLKSKLKAKVQIAKARMKHATKKLVATSTLTILLTNSVIPLTNVYADEIVITPNSNGHFVELDMAYDENDRYMKEDWDYDRVIPITLNLAGDILVSAFDISLKYDNSILTPSYYNRRSGQYLEATTMSQWNPLDNDYNFLYDYGVADSFNPSEGKIRLVGSISPPLNPNTYADRIIVGTLYFKVADGYEIADLKGDLIELSPTIGVGTSGMEISYGTSGSTRTKVTDPAKFGLTNFATKSKSITRISVKTKPNKTTYTQNEGINLTGGELTVHYDDGTTLNVSMTSLDVTNLTPVANINNPIIRLKYKGYFAEDIPITVLDPVISIEMTSPPTKLEYTQGETIDYSGGTIKVKYESGKENTIATDNSEIVKNELIADLTKGDVVLTGKTSTGLDCGKKTITLEYEGQTATYDIMINDAVQSIEAKDYKVDYKIGDAAVDRTQGKVIVRTEAGATFETPFENGSVVITGFKSYDIMKDRVITVKYFGKQTTYKVNINDYLKGIVIENLPDKMTYKCNDELDLTNGTIRANYASNAEETVFMDSPDVEVTGYDKTQSGNQTLTVKYKDKTVTFSINVIDEVKEIEIETTPKTEYVYEEGLDLTKGTIRVNYLSGKELSGVSLRESAVNVSGLDNTTLGKQTLTVTYTENGITANTTYNVEVQDRVNSMLLANTPTKTNYLYGEKIDVAGGELDVVYEFAGPDTIPITSSMITETDGGIFTTRASFPSGATTTTKDVKVNYRGMSVTYPITIINTLQKIEVTTPPTKSTYKYGENFDETGGKITVTRADGKTEEILLSDSNIEITGYDSSEENLELPLTVKYTENGITKETTFNVVVEDDVLDIKLNTTPKEEYKYGEDLEELEIIATRLSGEHIVKVTKKMTDYNPKKLGEQTVTITYGGQQVSFDINVVDYFKGIEVNTNPTKMKYTIGEKLDLEGLTICEVTASGVKGDAIKVTSDMVKGFDSTKVGRITLTITYKGEETTLVLTVGEVPPEPERPQENQEEQITTQEEDDDEDDNTYWYYTSYVYEEPVEKVVEEKIVEEKKEEEPKRLEREEKEKKDNLITGIIDNNSNHPDIGEIAGITLAVLFVTATLALLIIIGIKNKKNVEIYLEDGNERVLIGKEKITTNNRKLDLTKYYNRYEEEEFKIVLDKNISEKLDKKTVNVVLHDDKKETFKVEYENKAYTYKT